MDLPRTRSPIAPKVKSLIRSGIGRIVAARPGYTTHETVTVGRDVRRWKSVSFGGNNLIHSGVGFIGDVKIGYASTVGMECILAGPLEIGRYCQLGPRVAIYGGNHPTDHLSTYVNSRLLDGQMSSHARRRKVSIGHDVDWARRDSGGRSGHRKRGCNRSRIGGYTGCARFFNRRRQPGEADKPQISRARGGTHRADRMVEPP